MDNLRNSRYREEDVGRILLPHVIDNLSQDDPDRVLYEYSSKTGAANDFTPVSARRYANAINRAAWWLEKTLGRGSNFETLGYQGPGDLRYLVLTIAAIKNGYKMLFTSPRNSVEGDIAVIEAADCKTWLIPSEGSSIHRVLSVYPLNTVTVPDLEVLLDPESVEHFEYSKSWDIGRHEPCWVLHTSGSTGHPKPVIRNLASISCFGANALCRPVDGRPLVMRDFFHSRVYITFPLFHAAGLNNCMVWPLFYGCTMILGPQIPVTTKVMKEMIRNTNVDGVFTAPSLLEEGSSDKEFIVALKQIKVVAFAGGPLSQEAGDRISKVTKVVLSMGTTESGWHISVELDPEDWNNIRFHPNTGFELQEVAKDSYELVAIRKPELERWQMVFETFPNEDEYRFKDLFSKHPTKKDVWHYEGRSDNIIVLSNGEKVNPQNMELAIGSHPKIDALLIGGQGRFQTCLLIEPVRNTVESFEDDQELIEDLWPVIAEANKSAPAHARLFKDHILIASPSKPFLKASKGTIRRAPTLQLYQDEFDRLYALADSDLGSGPCKSLDLSSEGALRSDIRHAIQSVTELEGLRDDDDFFEAGIDSLQVLMLQRRLRRGLDGDHAKKDFVKSTLIYEYPTITLLSSAIYHLVTNGKRNGHGPPEHHHAEAMQDLLNEYTADLPSILRRHTEPTSSQVTKAIIILTGSTGSLGSYLLDKLIKSPVVVEIWALNRSADSLNRQTISSMKRGLVTDWESNNVRFRQADLTKQDLGLSRQDYEYLLTYATSIIHTQWQVDFNLSLHSFSQQIRGIRNLVDFAIAASAYGRDISIFFTSSIGVASNWQSSDSIPEQEITSFSAARTGYGESKLVAERILLEASRKSAVNATVCRVGQIAGPVRVNITKGQWNRKEWFPSIIDASAQLSLLPQTLGKNNIIDWIPVDILSDIILELVIAQSTTTEGSIFHAVNPTKISWEELLSVVHKHLAKNKNGAAVEIVPWSDWVEALSNSVATEVYGQKDAGLSALKLVNFFEGLSMDERPKLRGAFETKHTAAHSTSFKELPPVGTDWMEIWLEQWGY